MFCNKCGNQVPDNSAFCPVCGNNIAGNVSGGQQMPGAGMNGQYGGPQQNPYGGQQMPGAGMNGQYRGPQQNPYGGQQMPGAGMNGQYRGPQQNPYGGPQQMYGGQPAYGGPNGPGQGGQAKDPAKQKKIIMISIIAALIVIAATVTTIVLVKKHNDKKKADEAIATATSNYIVKSMKVDDCTACGTVLTAAQTAMADEDCYEEVIKAANNSNGEVVIVSIEAAKRDEFSTDNVSAIGPNLKAEMYSSLAGGVPIKYTEKGAKYFVVTVEGETLKAYISTTPDGRDWQIQPSTDPEYR